MKSLKSNAFIKTLSCIAFTFSSAICATALICVIIAGYVGCYSESTGEFLKTDYAKMYIENTSRYYAEEFSYTGNIERVHDAGLYLTIYDRGYPDTNITGRIYDENGNEIKISLENSSDIYDISSEENYYGEATANVKEQGPATNTGDFFTNGKAQNPGLSGDFEFTADNGKLYEIKYEIETPLPEGSSLFEQSQLYETVYPYRYAAADHP